MKKGEGDDIVDLKARRRRGRPPLFTRPRLVKTLICAAAGTLFFLSCADFDIWPLAWCAGAPLIAVLLHPTTTRPAWYGFICGLLANGGGFYWIEGFLKRFGHLPTIAAVPIFLLLISYQAITFAAFAWCLRRLVDRFDTGATFVAPTVYVALELCVPYVFPWYLAITQAWVRPVIQIADLTGPLGVSFLLVLVNAALFDAWSAWREKRPFPLPRLALALGVVALALGYGAVRIHQVEAARARAPKLKVGVVQANIGISEKWRPELSSEQLSVHQELARDLARRGAELILWPESSYPYYFARTQARDWPESDVRRARRGFTTPLLFGSLTAGPDNLYPFNSALLLDEAGEVRGLFDKNILMVFGEYIPFYEQMKFIKKWIPETSNWARGTDVTVFPLETRHGPMKLGPMICYEDIFPSFGRRLTKLGPNLLINITNDAWFGRTSEPYEHLALAIYRSVESRLDLVRAVNTGVSAFIDSTGRLYAKSPSVDPDETPGVKPATLLEEVAAQQPFTVYATLGEWFGGLCLLVTLALGLLARARGGSPVRWQLVGVGAATLALATLVLSMFLCGPGKLTLVIRILTHRPLGVGADESFPVGVRLAPVVALGCLLCGAVLARQQAARLEITMAVVAVLVVPALLFGTLEGEQAGLVISAAVAILLAHGGARLYTRIKMCSPR